MGKAHKILRAKMAEYDVDQKYLCKLIGRSQTYLTQRITAKKPWDITDMYTILKELNIQTKKMHKIFPDYTQIMQSIK